MRAALHRAAKKENHRRGAAPRASAHASRWADDELAEHAPRPPRLRAERRAWQRPLSGRSRVGQACHYGYDAHGNITFLTDATGAVTDSYDYDAWGILVASTGSTLNTRLYAGEEFDAYLGLLNLRARQYKSGTGRFVTIDPELGETQLPVSLNRYLYAGADPVNLLDPSGRAFAIELAAINVWSATVTTGAIVFAGYIAGCGVAAGLAAFDFIEGTSTVPVIWQWCAKGGRQYKGNEYSREAQQQPDPCSWLDALYKAARKNRQFAAALKIKLAQKALGCRRVG